MINIGAKIYFYKFVLSELIYYKKRTLQEIEDQNSLTYQFIKNGCLFIHIPKTGGISIIKSLFGHSGIGHIRAQFYKDILEKETFNKLFKFSFVRNPFDRLYSAYSFLNQGGMHEADKKWAANNLEKYENFEHFVLEWVTKKNIMKRVHFFPQHTFLCGKNDNIIIDFVGKIENVDADFNIIIEKLGKKTKLLMTNTSQRKKNYQEMYTEKMIDVVTNVYARDLKIFDYRF